ncbi:hypothetical protein HN954_00190 [bacterium]|nr:hypothetical protein [bacterium]MBT6832055.1 hypothetical protein [bacterium]MBT6995836.1 hypothetical protein [bacterium]
MSNENRTGNEKNNEGGILLQPAVDEKQIENITVGMSFEEKRVARQTALKKNGALRLPNGKLVEVVTCSCGKVNPPLDDLYYDFENRGCHDCGFSVHSPG